MSTFKRYLCVFLAIGIFVFIIGLILIIEDKELCDWRFIVIFALSICIYVFPMSIYLSGQASIVEIRIDKPIPDIIDKIDNISLNKCNRKRKEINGSDITYYMSNRFSAWLTNPIKVSNFDKYLILEVPKAYKKYYTSLL